MGNNKQPRPNHPAQPPPLPSVFTLIGRDTVRPSPRPDKWNLRAVFFIASVLAGVAMLSSLLLLIGVLISAWLRV